MGDIPADQFICAYCHVQANQRCTGCHETFYCSREHQKLHWRKHKNQCCAFKVRFYLKEKRFFKVCPCALTNK